MTAFVYNEGMDSMLTVRMKEYRKKCGITQAEMAKACHLSPNYVSALERGIYQPNAETLILWAAKCGVSIDALVGYERCSHINAELQHILSAMDQSQQTKLLEILKIMMKK